MAVSGYGAAADHAGLQGNTLGDPHPQYIGASQGTLAARPAIELVRNGTRYFATDQQLEYLASSGAWIVPAPPPSDTAVGLRGRFYRSFLFGGS